MMFSWFALFRLLVRLKTVLNLRPDCLFKFSSCQSVQIHYCSIFHFCCNLFIITSMLIDCFDLGLAKVFIYFVLELRLVICLHSSFL